MHALSWFELPAQDLERALAFYHRVVNGKVRMGTFGDKPLVLFDVPFQTGEAVGGAVVLREGFTPSAEGALVYLSVHGPLTPAVAQVEAAGGQVLVPEINLGAFGYAAIILDSEGNRVGLLAREL